MDTETIERLAMDRALGELNEDALALFDAYLAEHPEMQAWAKDMEDICTQTHAAVNSRTCKQSAGGRVARPWLGRAQWRTLGQWAAVVVAAVGIGAALGRWSRPGVEPSVVAVAEATSSSNIGSRQEALGSQAEGFWQNKALALLQTTSHVTTASSDSQTNPWARYRLNRKERSYE